MSATILQFPIRAEAGRAGDDWTIQALRNIGVHEERISPSNLSKFERLRQLLREAEPIRAKTPLAVSVQAKVNAILPVDFDPAIATQIADVLREALKDAVPISVGHPGNGEEV